MLILLVFSLRVRPVGSRGTLTWNWTPFVVNAETGLTTGGNQILLRWPSLAGKSYDVLWATNLLSGFSPVAVDLPATPPVNVYQSTVGSPRTGFYTIRMK